MFMESPSLLISQADSTSAPMLCRARVLQAECGRLLIQPDDDPGKQVWAESAVAHCYEPVPGDLVLAIGQRGCHYVVGVIQGTGNWRITAPGNVEIRAPRGRIGLVARHGVHLEGDELSLTAGRLTVVANTLIERLAEATRWVRGACQVRAGRMRLAVEDDYRLKAGRIHQRADHDVKIDGSKIHLG
jgi:hypothetical protein